MNFYKDEYISLCFPYSVFADSVFITSLRSYKNTEIKLGKPELVKTEKGPTDENLLFFY